MGFDRALLQRTIEDALEGTKEDLDDMESVDQIYYEALASAERHFTKALRFLDKATTPIPKG